MPNVLYKVTGMNAGGIETFLINVQKNIMESYSSIHIDYYLNSGVRQFYSKQIYSYGGHIYYPDGVVDNRRFFNWKARLKRLWDFYKFLKRNSYDIVHINENLPATAAYTLVCKAAGIPNVIVHSHNDLSHQSFSVIQSIKYRLSRIVISNFSDYRFACSDVAGKWFYGDSTNHIKSYALVKNGIAVETYRFSSIVRGNYREKLQIQGKFVLGHVGRFYPQKNHSFLLKIFKELVQHEPNAVLLLIGDGPRKEDIVQKVQQMGLREKVLFLGIRKDVAQILQAMDCFCLPSLHEGLPLVAIEAQASGLPIICSTNVTREVMITKNCFFCSLEANPLVWVKEILEHRNVVQREKGASEVISAGFDSKDVAKKLGAFYLDIV